MQKVVNEFATALYNLLSACCSQEVPVTGLCAPSTPVVEAPKEKKEKFPKKFSDFCAGRTDAVAKVACKTWSKDKIEFLIPKNMEAAMDEEIGALTDEFRRITGNKEVEIICTLAVDPAPAAKKEEKKVDVITADMVKAACVALTLKLKNKDKVFEILDGFGSRKIDEIDPAKYAELHKALKQTFETSNLSSENDSGW